MAILARHVIALAASLAHCDAPAKECEWEAFVREFGADSHESAEARRLFLEAPPLFDDFQWRSWEIARLAPRSCHGPLVAALERVARADGVLHPLESALLRRTAGILNVELVSGGDEGDDPWSTLGVSRHASMSEVKAAWRRLCRLHHPDRIATEEGLQAEATQRMARLNRAYRSALLG